MFYATLHLPDDKIVARGQFYDRVELSKQGMRMSLHSMALVAERDAPKGVTTVKVQFWEGPEPIWAHDLEFSTPPKKGETLTCKIEGAWQG